MSDFIIGALVTAARILGLPRHTNITSDDYADLVARGAGEQDGLRVHIIAIAPKAVLILEAPTKR